MQNEPRIGILVVAYNAATTLARVLDRIPRDFTHRIAEVLVSDDGSQDSTYLVGMGYRQIRDDLPLTVIRQPMNLGYGGNQKVGYEWAIEKNLDIVVLLHGDGQYAPELLPEMVAPLENGSCDAVFGSRMLEPGAARKGGMPLYKLYGNRILTRFENTLAGAELSEWHSGYRAYRVDALKDVPFERNSDGFDFDTQIILQFLEAGKRITEIPIPTFYGDEICYVNGVRYARDISKHVLKYRLQSAGFGNGESLSAAPGAYEKKSAPDTSHSRILSWIGSQKPGKVLDIGCSDGSVASELRASGHEVTGIDLEESPGVRENVDHFFKADLDKGLPAEIVGKFDIVLAADVVEHVRDPANLLSEMRELLSSDGSIVVSVPNFGHWYPRTRILFGSFDYDRRGILDGTHLRFFTRSSFERLIKSQGLRVKRRHYIGLPIEVLYRGTAKDGDQGKSGKFIKIIDKVALQLRPTLFAYQFVYELAVDKQAKPELLVNKSRKASPIKASEELGEAGRIR
ncbi:Glycosyl transferase family 2/Methyltransferase domain [Actinobacteria bacterium IMCC26256]|nr:Glycosyl transferase family 2/Methyltransferase domain [Actinobacteria bacterium IMCC26256]